MLKLQNLQLLKSQISEPIMTVFILTLRENNEGSRLIKNYGVFSKRYLTMAFIIQNREREVKFHGGRFAFTTVEDFSDRENELDFKPNNLKVYENDFYAAYAEISFLQ